MWDEAERNILNEWQVSILHPLISGVGKFDHITPVMKSLHWLPIELRIKFKVLCLAYEALHGLAPAHLSDTLVWYDPTLLLTLPVCIVRGGVTGTTNIGQCEWLLCRCRVSHLSLLF